MRINYGGVTITLDEKHVYFFDYPDFDNLVREVYGRDFEVIAAEELDNDVCIELGTIPTRGDFTKWDERRLQEFVDGGSMGNKSSLILRDMYRRGILPAGTYMVDVSY